MNTGNVPADVLLPIVAQQPELGGVGPDDHAFGREPMQCQCRIIEEILQVAFVPPCRFPRPLLLGNIERNADDTADAAIGLAIRLQVEIEWVTAWGQPAYRDLTREGLLVD